MIDMTYFGNKYFNWQEENSDDLIHILEKMGLNYTFEFHQDEVAGVHSKDGEYGYPGKVASLMEDQWTYFYHNSKLHFYFKSENDKIKAILLK